MFGMLSNLTKAAVSIAVAPVAVAVDVIMLHADAEGNKDAFSRTSDLLSNAGDCVDKAIKPD